MEPALQMLGRYSIYGQIAAGGMASVHFARLAGSAGFERTVAIKRLHPHLARDPEFVSMFLDEARLAARVHNPNVASTLDVVSQDEELFVVMEYVHGESLARLWRAAQGEPMPIPLPVVLAIVTGILRGLHAAHEARNELGEPLGIVHRDISPPNVLVGLDGVPRVIDFGVAKANDRLHSTHDGRVKGKLAYMAPEQLRGGTVDRRSDVYAVGVVLWELLTRQRLFMGDNDAMTITNVLERGIERPSKRAPGISDALDPITLRALARDPAKRFETARQMAVALEAFGPVATPTGVGEWVESLAGDALTQRAEALARIEGVSGVRGAHDTELRAPASLPAPADGSQASSISVATPSKREAPASRSRWTASLALTVGVVSVGLWLLLARSAARPPSVTGVAPNESATLSLSVSAPAPVPPSATAMPASTAPATPVAPSKRGGDSVHAPFRRSSSPTDSSAHANCNPPYTIDTDGVRHYKPQCPLN